MKQTIKDFCKQIDITEKQFSGKEKISGYLDLRGLTSIPQGFNPTVGGYLDLSGLTSIPQGFNPTVGGSLYLRGLTSIPQGFNPTVGGSLYLRGLTSIPQGFNPTVGGSLYLRYGVNANHSPLNNKILSWADGKYISADGIFTEVLSKKGNVYKVKKLNDPKEFYLVSDGQSFHSHGDTLKQAKEDLRFKMIADKLKKEPIKKDTIITVQYYRIITGACEAGVKNWMKENNIKKTQYKASELLPLLEKTNAYGVHRFKELVQF